jgi:hypothetical protein
MNDRPAEPPLMPPAQDNMEKVRSFPDLLQKEALAAGLALALVCVIAALWDAPIQAPADPSGIPADNVKAPWIFVGIQQALRHLPALIAGIVLPVTAVLILAFVPFFPEGRRRLGQGLFVVITLAAVALTVWGYFV